MRIRWTRLFLNCALFVIFAGSVGAGIYFALKPQPAKPKETERKRHETGGTEEEEETGWKACRVGENAQVGDCICVPPLVQDASDFCREAKPGDPNPPASSPVTKSPTMDEQQTRAIGIAAGVSLLLFLFGIAVYGLRQRRRKAGTAGADWYTQEGTGWLASLFSSISRTQIENVLYFAAILILLFIPWTLVAISPSMPESGVLAYAVLGTFGFCLLAYAHTAHAAKLEKVLHTGALFGVFGGKTTAALTLFNLLPTMKAWFSGVFSSGTNEEEVDEDIHHHANLTI